MSVSNVILRYKVNCSLKYFPCTNIIRLKWHKDGFVRVVRHKLVSADLKQFVTHTNYLTTVIEGGDSVRVVSNVYVYIECVNDIHALLMLKKGRGAVIDVGTLMNVRKIVNLDGLVVYKNDTA